MALIQGAVFSSFDDFNETLKEYSLNKKCIFVKVNGRTIELENKKIQRPEKHYPLAWRYLSVKFVCKHYGTYSGRGTGKRPLTDTFKTGCEVFIQLAASKTKGGLVINKLHLDHSNHDLMTDENESSYPENRRLTEGQLEELKMLLDLRVSTVKIIDHFQQSSGLKLNAQDIRNARAKLSEKKSEDSLLQELFRSIKSNDEGAVIDVDVSPENEARIIFVQTSNMRQNIIKYPSVLFVDATYKINNRAMPLFSFLTVDGGNNGQVAAYAIVINECADTIKSLFDILLKYNTHLNTDLKTIVIDKDFSEINAVSSTFPNASLVLCKWHVDRAIQRSLKGYPAELKEVIMETIRKMMRCTSEDEYDNLKSILTSYPQFMKYFLDNWDSVKTSWVGAFVRESITFGHMTNNFVESHNQKIKFSVDSYFSIPSLIKELIGLSEKKTERTNLKISKLKLKKKLISYDKMHMKDCIEKINKHCAPYSARILIQQLQKSVEKISIVDGNSVTDQNGKTYFISENKCNCFMSQCQKLVCAHLFSYRQHKGLPLFSIEDIPAQHSLSTYFNNPDVDSNSSISLRCSVVQQRKKLSQNEKFRKSQAKLSEICSILSNLGQTEFDYQLDMFSQILDSVKRNKQVVFYECDIHQPQNDFDNEQNPDHENVSSQTNEVLPSNVPNNPTAFTTPTTSTATTGINNDWDVTDLDNSEVFLPSSPENVSEIAPTSNETDNLDVSFQNTPAPFTDIASTSTAVNTFSINSCSQDKSVPPAADGDPPIFKLPTIVKKRGRPKQNKKTNVKKKRRLNNYESSVTRLLKQIIDPQLVPIVLDRKLFIDSYMIRDTIPIELLHSSVDLSEYFSINGWTELQNRLLSLGEQLLDNNVN